ncbi:histidine kinase [Nibrella viscosa]|uniref:Histidine kinase n=1 Tax=Nibrella viscosa TaxID=1084524 RepID=A0ABP8KS96_9BACT
MRTLKFPNYIRYLFITPPLFMAVLYVTIYMNTGYWRFGLVVNRRLWEEVWMFLLESYIILVGIDTLIPYFNKRFAPHPNHWKRYAQEIAVLLVTGLALVNFVHWAFETFIVVPEADVAYLQLKLRQSKVIILTTLLITYAFLSGLNSFRLMQRARQKAIRLQKEFVQVQFETLKNQLNPHFLFNSLSVLSSLVHIDPDLSEQFIEKLSKAYRYFLEQREKETVPLQTELDFAETIAFLFTVRFPKKLIIDIEQPAITANDTIPPLATFLLIEHAITHSVMSAQKPLKIRLFTNGDHTLHIEHPWQPRPNEMPVSDIALQSLSERYQYLTDRTPFIGLVNDMYVAQLPLLQSA